MIVKLAELKEKVLLGVRKLGYKGEDAQIIADVLLYAQTRGNNQGITKVATGGVPKFEDTEPFKIVRENKCGVLFSGGQSMASTVKAADKAVELAKIHGVGIAAVNHTHTSSGAIGYYARRVANKGYICLITVGNGDWAAVAPLGSAEPKLGTNPIAYAFPYDGGQVVFDTATAAIAYYGVLEAFLKKESLPEGVALNSKGEFTVKASEVLGKGQSEAVGGAIATFAGQKGYGFSVLVQLLGSAFALGGFVGGYGEDGGGTFIMALDPGLLAGTDEYMKRSRDMVASIKSAKPISGQRVMMPGERGDELAHKVEQSGQIEIPDAIWKALDDFIRS